ncbi:MAG: tRNA pseudouridine(55) synthase TruB [Oleiphilaceae bacterium]|nr:tRNA pseudouridine(55) synthase TruB [Oleiphilaceae bacterium]
MSRKRKGRPLDGVLVVDKPQGASSNQVLQRARRLYGAAKAGHTGALDPLATGVLPLCFGEATKFSQYLLEADKGYLTTATLGVRTETSDSDGATVATRALPEDLSRERLESVLDSFRGAIHQVPSMYSALKHQGQPLYRYAREGITVERPARPVRIHELELIRIEGDQLELRVECSKGTYIRTLVDDIGEALGCGAHVSRLRRTSAGPFTLADAVTLESLEALQEAAEAPGPAGEESRDWSALDARLLPADQLIADLPVLTLDSAQSHSILQGQAVRMTAPTGPGEVRLYHDGRFLGLAEVQPDGEVRPRRLVSTQ